MTLLVVRLRLAMWRTAMTRSALHLVSSVLGGLGALAVLGVLGPGLLLLAGRPLRVVALTVPLFTVVTLMWAVLSLIATGVDSTLDPARFSVLPLRASELARGLLAAALTGIPAVMLCGLALAQAGAWATRPAAVVAALVAAVLGVLTAVFLSRAVTSALARVMTSRGGRVAGAFVVALVTLVPLGLNLLLTTGSLAADLSTFDATRSATVASWTPFGWAWGLPFDVATGRWASAGVHLVLAVGFVLALHAVWVRQLERTLTAPPTSSGGQRIGRGRLLPAVMGTSPTATIAARRVRAWYRDSRLVGIALRTAVLPVFFVVQAVATDAPGLAGVGIVTLAVFAGLTLMNDLAFDGPAWWLHVAVGVRGWEDRLGRALASTVVFGPVVLLTYAVSLGARGHLEPAAVADRRRRRLLRQPRPGRRGGCRAPGHGAAHRWQPVRGDLRWGGPGLPHRHRVVRRADPAHPARRAPRRRDRRQPDRAVGGTRPSGPPTPWACSPSG